MSIFANYARYYDLLYRDKNYHGEIQFIEQLLQTHAPSAQNILELGCGTGYHALLLSKKGYSVVGVDLSQQMLEKARERLQEIPGKLSFYQGDIRSIRIEQQFDAILSLFHVISYQTLNADLQATFKTIKNHLKPSGVCIFDVWYGPAVLSDRPSNRIKRLEDDTIKVTRIAEPAMYSNDNLVDVHYHVFISDKNTGAVNELQETHTMRYLFKPEIELFLANEQLRLIDCREWMTNQEPSFQTWGVYFVIGHQR